MTDEVLSVADRIRNRRAARDQNGAAPIDRQPREVVEQEQPVVTAAPGADLLAIINDGQVEEVVLKQEDVVEVEAPQPTTHRRQFAPPVPKPADAVAPTAEPRQRRRIITEAELPQNVATEPTKAEVVKQEVITKPESIPAQPESRMERVRDQAASASQGLIIGLLEHMRAGEQLLITRDGQGLWSIVLPTSVVGSYEVKVAPSGKPIVQRTVEQGRLPNNFEDSLRNPAYVTFQVKWRSMDDKQKVAHAKSLSITLPDATLDPRVFNMQLMQLVGKAEGIDKWKPEYSTSAARAAAKDKAMKGLPY